jgi:hypothetical protein
LCIIFPLQVPPAASFEQKESQHARRIEAERGKVPHARPLHQGQYGNEPNQPGLSLWHHKEVTDGGARRGHYFYTVSSMLWYFVQNKHLISTLAFAFVTLT